MNYYHITFHIPEDPGDEFWAKIPAHRNYIDTLLNKGVVLSYCVNADRTKGWASLTAENVTDARKMMASSPLGSYLEFEIEELIFYNAATNSLPVLSLN